MPGPETENKQSQNIDTASPMETLARDMSHPGQKQGTKFQSTHAKVMKNLTRAFYNLPKDKADDVAFLSMVILDAKAARLRAKSRETLESHELAHVSGDISSTLSKMQQSKNTVAFHSKYVQEFTPMQADANQRQMQVDELGNAITTFLGDLHTKLKALDTKSEKEQEMEITALTKQWQQLENQSERLGINVESLLQKLHALHQEAYGLLPDKTGAPTPKGVGPRPTEAPKTPTSTTSQEPGMEGPE